MPAMDLTDDQCLEHITNSKNEIPRKQTTKLKLEQGTDRVLKKKYNG